MDSGTKKSVGPITFPRIILDSPYKIIIKIAKGMDLKTLITVLKKL